MKKQMFNQFQLSDFISENDKFHISRINISGLENLSFHTHDYVELFWVESGYGIHHINGEKINLVPYDIVMIRSNDLHTFSSRQGNLIIVNIAFTVDTLKYYKERYFPNSNKYFWSNSLLPHHFHSTKETIDRFTIQIESAMKRQRSNIQLDSLMLFIFKTIINEEHYINEKSQIPSWLVKAMEQFKRPEYFIKGCDGFTELCKHNQDYIGRIIKKTYYKTLTEYINEVKMEYAATQLIMTSMPIKEISNRCGIVSLGHFYNLFYKAYKTSPYKYRIQNQKIV